MIITCPNCAKRYQLDEALIPKEGRTVKCFACQTTWEQKALLTLDEHHVVTSLPPLPHLGHLEEERFTEQKPKFFKGFLIVVLLAIIGAATLYFCQSSVMQIFPKATKWYERLGVLDHKSKTGLVIINKKSSQVYSDEKSFIILSGDIMNTSSYISLVPTLKVLLLGNVGSPACLNKMHDGKCIFKEIEHHLAEKSLLPGEKIHFETEPQVQELGITNIDVVF